MELKNEQDAAHELERMARLIMADAPRDVLRAEARESYRLARAALAAGAPADAAKHGDAHALAIKAGFAYEYESARGVHHYRGYIEQIERLIAAAQAALVQPVPRADADISYELMQDDMCVAGTSGKGALAEIQHYAAVYAQDGPVEIVEVTRRVLTPADGATA